MILVEVVIFEIPFQWKKYKQDYDDEIFAVVCTKQVCSLMSGEFNSLLFSSI